MKHQNSERRNSRWSNILVWVGPVSWLVLAVYVLVRNQVAWGGLAALYSALPISLVIHTLAPLALIMLACSRHRRRQPVGKMVVLGLVYYVSIPVLIVALSIQIQGLSGTLAWGEMIMREIKFQRSR